MSRPLPPAPEAARAPGGTREPVDRAAPDPVRTPVGRLELGLVLAVHVALYAILNGNFDHDFDAQQYGRIAHEIALGEYALFPHPFSQRFAVTFPAALCLRLLGEGWVGATLWPLLASLLTIATVHFALRRTVGRRAAFAGAALLATNLIQVRFASRLLPDVVVSCFMLLAAVCIERGRSGPGAGQIRAGLGAALALLAGLLAKATVIWAGPFLGGLMLLDLARGRNRKLWAATSIGVVLASALFLGGYWWLTGDAFYRVHGIESIHNERAGFFEGGLGVFADRLTYGPLVYLIERPGFGLALLLALPAMVLATRAPRRETGSARYWSGYALGVMGSFWFGSTSLEVYTPLYLSDRFLQPFLAPLAILGAITIARVLEPWGRGWRSRLELAPLLFGALASAALLFRDGIKRAALYAALAIVGALAARPARSRPRPPVEAKGVGAAGVATGRTVLVLAAMAVPLLDYARRGDPHETPHLIVAERRLVAGATTRGPFSAGPVAVLTDPHSSFVLPYYVPPDAPGSPRFVSWETLPLEPLPGERVFVYVHPPRLFAVNLNWDQPIPDFTREIPSDWEVVDDFSQDGVHHVRLFELDADALVALNAEAARP